MKEQITEILRKINSLKTDYIKKYNQPIRCVYTDDLLLKLQSPEDLMNQARFLNKFIEACTIFEPNERNYSYYQSMLGILLELQNILKMSSSPKSEAKSESELKSSPKTSQPILQSASISSANLILSTLFNNALQYLCEQYDIKQTEPKLVLTATQYRQIGQWIGDHKTNSPPPFDLTTVNLNYCLSPPLDIPLVCLAAYTNAYHKVGLMAESGANINDSDPSHNMSTPLMYAVTQKASTAILKILIKAGANPNLEDVRGITPYLQAIILDNKEVIEFLAKHGGKIVWQKVPTTSYFKDLYDRLKDMIISEHKKAVAQGKELLIPIIEQHNHYESQIIEAIIIDILHHLNIDNCYLEFPPDYKYKDDIAINIANHHKMKLKFIDVNLSLDINITQDAIASRNESMIKKLLGPDSGSGPLIIGAGHAIIGSNPAIQKKFHVFPICTTNKYLERTYIPFWEKENFLYVKKNCTPVYFTDGYIVHSKEIVDFLIDIEKNLAANKSLYPLFVKREIFKDTSLKVKTKVQSSLTGIYYRQSVFQSISVTRLQALYQHKPWVLQALYNENILVEILKRNITIEQLEKLTTEQLKFILPLKGAQLKNQVEGYIDSSGKNITESFVLKFT